MYSYSNDVQYYYICCFTWSSINSQPKATAKYKIYQTDSPYFFYVLVYYCISTIFEGGGGEGGGCLFLLYWRSTSIEQIKTPSSEFIAYIYHRHYIIKGEQLLNDFKGKQLYKHASPILKSK